MPRPPPPPPQLLTTLAMAGVQVCYAAQINLGTTHLVRLGLPHKFASLAWLAGPLAGLIVQPIVGFLSDNCTHPLGRRRPFIIVGALLTSLSLLAFSNSTQLATLIVSKENIATISLTLAVVSFFALDFSIQAIQAPLRALVNDIMPPAKLSSANSCISFYCGVGNLVGGLLTAVHWSSLYGSLLSDIQMVFALSAIFLIATTCLTVWSTKEQPLTTPKPPLLSSSVSAPSRLRSKSATSASLSSRIYTTLRGIPDPFWGVFVIQLCTWCGFFTLFVYVNSWMAHNVFGGDPMLPSSDPRRKLFDAGVRLGGTANALTAVITIVYSAMLPRLLRTFGTTVVYVFSQLVEAFTLMAAIGIRPGTSPPSAAWQLLAVGNIGAFGVVWATTVSVPWTIIMTALDSDPYYAANKGLFTTLFNVSQSFPQLIVAFVAPLILALRDDSAHVMFVGGLVALLGAVLVVWFRVDRSIPKPRPILDRVASMSSVHVS